MSPEPTVPALDLPLAYYASALARWRPWRDPETGHAPQLDLIRAAATAKVRVFRASNRSGKSAGGAADTALFWAGWHPFARRSPPRNVWCSALDWEMGVGQVMWPALKPFVPWGRVRSVVWYRRAEPALPISLVLDDGSQLAFKSSEAGRSKYQGVKLDLCWLDEEQPPEVVEEARARLIDTGGWLTVTLTPVQRLRWVAELEREPGTAVIRASAYEAARAGLLDLAALERYLASLPERQRSVRGFGDFVALEGLVYPDFRRARHVARPRAGTLVSEDGAVDRLALPWPLPETWPRWAAMDFGYGHPAAVVVAAEQPDAGRLVVERVYKAGSLRASRWADLLKTRLPELVVPVVCDHDLNDRAELEAAGIATSAAEKAPPNKTAGLEAVERLVQDRDDGAPGLVLVCDEATDPVLGRCDAEALAWELELYHYPAAREGRPTPRDEPVKRDDDAADAARFLVLAWEHGRNRRSLLEVPRPRDREPDVDLADAAGERDAARWGPRRPR